MIEENPCESQEDVERNEQPLLVDGGYDDLHSGTTRATVYYWLDPETDAALEHTGLNDERTIPFFPDENSAKEYLERRADSEEKERYDGFSLYKARTRKVGDAVDVLTDQSGIEDFMPDGGTQLQIDNPAPDRVWFWYNPAADHVVQEEVEPYDVRGLFKTEEDAHRFLDWYAEQHGIGDTSHLELYSANLEYKGTGTSFLTDDMENQTRTALPEQVDLTSFRE